MIESITAICVCYRTKELVQIAIESFRKFYPDMPLIVVDNSAREGKCTRYLHEFVNTDDNASIFAMAENVGHGPGMDYALKAIKTEWAYIFDSDTEMIAGGLVEFAESAIKDKTILAAGNIQLVSSSGLGNEQRKQKVNIPYVHPAVCFINRLVYAGFPPFKYHGAPCIDTYMRVHKTGQSRNLLMHLLVGQFVKHTWRGTRSFYKMKPWTNK